MPIISSGCRRIRSHRGQPALYETLSQTQNQCLHYTSSKECFHDQRGCISMKSIGWSPNSQHDCIWMWASKDVNKATFDHRSREHGCNGIGISMREPLECRLIVSPLPSLPFSLQSLFWTSAIRTMRK